MKLCRFEKGGRVLAGRIVGTSVSVCSSVIGGTPVPTGEEIDLAEVRLLAPIVPGKIIGIGRNYAAHARELGNLPPESDPLLFLKPPSALLDHGQPIVLPSASSRVDHEGELGVIIGRQARKLGDAEDPLDFVLGYTCVNDVTARDLQKKDVQFTRGKGFDTFCPVGPWIETDLDASRLRVRTRVNGDTRQDGNTADLIFPVGFLIRYISWIMTLHPGDLIATGTPAGVGPLQAGDVVEVEVEGIGILSNPVVASDDV